jgi:hypothetical protein
MADPACLALQIPERLHTEDRKPDPHFGASEWLYRWIAKGYERKDLVAGFSLNPGESVNRERHSKYPADVLFNAKTGKHRVGFAILAFDVRLLRQPFASDQQNTTYSYDVVHKPVPCMYPHCEIEVTMGGQITTKVPPLVRRTWRDAIVDSHQRQVLINHALPTD